MVYLAWALESIPDAVHEDYHLQEMEVDFKAECKAGDTVQSSVMQLKDLSKNGGGGPSGTSTSAAAIGSNGNGNGSHAYHPSSSDEGEVYFLHTIELCNEEGCTELVRARSTWRKRQRA